MQAQNLAAGTYSPTGAEEPFGMLFVPLISVILVIFLAYVGTRWIAKKYRQVALGKCVKVIERIPLGKDRDLVTVETDGMVYVLGITGGGVTVICTYDAEKLPKSPPEAAPGFASVLDAIKKRGEFISIPPFNHGGKDEAGHP